MGKYISSECESLDDCSSPSADLTDRYPGDAALRAAGFRIFARPRGGPDVWTLNRWDYGAKKFVLSFFTEQQAHESQYAQRNL